MSDSSVPPEAQQSTAAPPRARANVTPMSRNIPTGRNIVYEERLAKLERHARTTEGRLNTAEPRIDATGQLAGQLDGFAAGVAAHSARLDELTVAHQTAIEALGATFEAKLEIIEAAFKDGDRKIRELQQAAHAAPAAGIASPPGMAEPAGLALLRGRLDDLAREALTSSGQRAELHGKHKELDDRIIAMDVNIRDRHVDTACQLVQGVGAVRAELAQGFAYVAQQIAGLEQRTAAGAEPGPNFAA